MANTIEHQGIVENTTESDVRVRIVQTSACAACSAKGMCAAADRKEKIIETAKPAFECRPGDTVTVTGTASMGMTAVCIAFVFPFFLLVVSLFVCMFVTNGNEPLSALLALAVLIPYYFILWIKKDALKRKLTFTIKP